MENKISTAFHLIKYHCVQLYFRESYSGLGEYMQVIICTTAVGLIPHFQYFFFC